MRTDGRLPKSLSRFLALVSERRGRRNSRFRGCSGVWGRRRLRGTEWHDGRARPLLANLSIRCTYTYFMIPPTCQSSLIPSRDVLVEAGWAVTDGRPRRTAALGDAYEKHITLLSYAKPHNMQLFLCRHLPRLRAYYVPRRSNNLNHSEPPRPTLVIWWVRHEGAPGPERKCNSGCRRPAQGGMDGLQAHACREDLRHTCPTRDSKGFV